MGSGGMHPEKELVKNRSFSWRGILFCMVCIIKNYRHSIKIENPAERRKVEKKQIIPNMLAALCQLFRFEFSPVTSFNLLPSLRLIFTDYSSIDYYFWKRVKISMIWIILKITWQLLFKNHHSKDVQNKHQWKIPFQPHFTY